MSGLEAFDRRFRSIMVNVARHCGKTIASSLDGWAKIQAAYRFFDNERVVPELMLAPHIENTAQRIAASGESTVLLLQDTIDRAIARASDLDAGSVDAAA